MTDTSSKDKEMIYGLTADEHDALREGLNELPDTMPPRIVWQRIREQAEAEGLLGKSGIRQPRAWYMGGSLAAAVVLGVLIAPLIAEDPSSSTDSEFANVPTNDVTNEQTPLTTLQALMVESRQLEYDLSGLPEQPRVARAGTSATISELEDRIAAIDYQLNDPSVRMTAEEQEIFWRERVRLMKSLLGLRYAQAQRTAF